MQPQTKIPKIRKMTQKLGSNSTGTFKKILFALFLMGILSVGCSSASKSNEKKYQNLYQDLLEKFPPGSIGFGLEPTFPKQSYQPMTYALVLESEGIHNTIAPNQESEAIIREAALWLIENQDLDQDGKVGWGLPDAWDAFQDDSPNPENHPYTITTALVLQAFLVSINEQNASIWTETEYSQILDVVIQSADRWCTEAWTDDEVNQISYFWYSTAPEDSYFVLNVNSMFAGVLQELIHLHEDEISEAQLDTFTRSANQAMEAVIDQTLFKDGHPYWPYIGIPNVFNRVTPNDLVHHSYIVWGIEQYRENNGELSIPWTRDESVASYQLFYRDKELYRFPQGIDEVSESNQERKPRLWSVGMHLAVVANFGDQQTAYSIADDIEKNYGPGPDYILFPPDSSDYEGENFYPRFASHLLLGYAYMLYSDPPLSDG